MSITPVLTGRVALGKRRVAGRHREQSGCRVPLLTPISVAMAACGVA